MRQKFRASIYLDLFVDLPQDFTSFKKVIDEAREAARLEAQELADRLPNAYVGGVATVEELMRQESEI